MTENELLKVKIEGLPPTVNHMHINAHGRRIKTQACRDFQEQTTAELQQLWHNKPPFKDRVALYIIFSTNNRRRWDIDNRVKALQDCLTFAGVIQDDSQIDFIQIERRYEKEVSTTLILKEFQH